jgi:hypothetical protein
MLSYRLKNQPALESVFDAASRYQQTESWIERALQRRNERPTKKNSHLKAMMTVEERAQDQDRSNRTSSGTLDAIYSPRMIQDIRFKNRMSTQSEKRISYML